MRDISSIQVILFDDLWAPFTFFHSFSPHFFLFHIPAYTGNYNQKKYDTKQ